MPHIITCTACRQAIEIPEANKNPWLNCPHCRTRNVNPAALEQAAPGKVTWMHVLGTLLVLSGFFGAVLGTGAVWFGEVFSLREVDSVRIFITFASFVSLAAAGYLVLIRGGEAPSQVAKVGLIIVLLLMTVSGLIYVSSCPPTPHDR